MRRRDFVESAVASVALSPLSQIDVRPDKDDDQSEDEEEVEILLHMSRRKYRELREKGEIYKIEEGIWRFIPEEHRE
jgi:RNA polymerase-binding transcription factor DksA